MEQQKKYEEWFLQSDYDLDTAFNMLEAGRNIYCIFMCHLSLEKALKGLYTKRLNQVPPKLHDLMYFIDKVGLDPEKTHKDFILWLNRMAIITRYTDDLRNMIKMFPYEQTNSIYLQTKTLQQWITQQ